MIACRLPTCLGRRRKRQACPLCPLCAWLDGITRGQWCAG